MVLRKLYFTLTLLSALMLSPVQAQEGQAQPARDVRVVVDISGSMKVNDPDNLRRPAVRLLARLLPDGTYTGLWTFGEMVNMLVPHGALDQELRSTLVRDSERINSVAQRTNIGAAIEDAADNWYAPDRSLEHTHLILLSDGKVDVSPSQASNDRERERILTELVPALAEQGLTIHTIALSAAADLDLLGAIADRTGGIARVAVSADELSRIFADTMGQAVPANEVPLEGNRFTVDGGVEEFTALIFSATSPEQRELTLMGPDGERHNATDSGESVRWARESGYDLITVVQPKAGEWRLEGTLGEGSRVTVVSDLRLEVEPIPARFRMGDTVTLQASFTEGGKRITDPDFLGVITVSLTITTEDGRQGTRVLSEGQPPADGLYQDTIDRLPDPGQYLLELKADGSTFSRKFRKTLVLEVPEGQADSAPADAVPVAIDPAEPEPAIAPAGPIDLSQVEEPEPVPPSPEPAAEPEAPAVPQTEQDTEDAAPSLLERALAWWPWVAGALGGLILLVLMGVVLKRRRNREDPAAADSGEPDTVSPTDAGTTDSTASVETVEEAGEEATEEVSSIAEPEELAEQAATVAPEEPAPVAGDPPEADVVLDSLEEAPDDDRVPETGSPDIAAAEPEDTTPESEQPEAEINAGEDSLQEEDEDEEFGLEDFDLSDIDELPDLEVDDNEAERDTRSRARKRDDEKP